MSPKLECSYLGLRLTTPVVVGACPLTLAPESLRQMVLCGAGAAVLPSIFQEQIDRQETGTHRPHPAGNTAEFMQSYNGGPDCYLTLLEQARQSASIPIIASMNGYGSGDWLGFARSLEGAGADALELNVQPLITSAEQSAAAMEAQLCELVARVCSSVSIPVTVKLTRHYTNPANMAHRLQQAGAKGVVLFAHEVKWDVATDRLHWTPHWELTPVDSLGPTLSGLIQTRLGGLGLSIAASGGIRTAEDAIKTIIAGADVAMIASEIYRTGPEAIRKIVLGIERYLDDNGFDSLAHVHASRPTPQTRREQAARLDYLDPLTRTEVYHDPTPEAARPSGDRYGHKD